MIEVVPLDTVFRHLDANCPAWRDFALFRRVAGTNNNLDHLRFVSYGEPCNGTFAYNHFYFVSFVGGVWSAVWTFGGGRNAALS